MLKNNFDLELKRSLSEVRALTLEEWLSAASPCTQNPAFPGFSILLAILSHNHWPLNVTSGIALITNGIGCFNLTTIKATIPLYRFPLHRHPRILQLDTDLLYANTFRAPLRRDQLKFHLFLIRFSRLLMNLPHHVVSYSKVILKTLEIFLISVYMPGEMCALNAMGSESLRLRTVVYP